VASRLLPAEKEERGERRERRERGEREERERSETGEEKETLKRDTPAGAAEGSSRSRRQSMPNLSGDIKRGAFPPMNPKKLGIREGASFEAGAVQEEVPVKLHVSRKSSLYSPRSQFAPVNST